MLSPSWLLRLSSSSWGGDSNSDSSESRNIWPAITLPAGLWFSTDSSDGTEVWEYKVFLVTSSNQTPSNQIWPLLSLIQTQLLQLLERVLLACLYRLVIYLPITCPHHLPKPDCADFNLDVTSPQEAFLKSPKSWLWSAPPCSRYISYCPVWQPYTTTSCFLPALLLEIRDHPRLVSLNRQ